MAATIAPTVVSSWWAGRTTLTRAPPLPRAELPGRSTGRR